MHIVYLENSVCSVLSLMYLPANVLQWGGGGGGEVGHFFYVY